MDILFVQAAQLVGSKMESERQVLPQVLRQVADRVLSGADVLVGEADMLCAKADKPSVEADKLWVEVDKPSVEVDKLQALVGEGQEEDAEVEVHKPGADTVMTVLVLLMSVELVDMME